MPSQGCPACEASERTDGLVLSSVYWRTVLDTRQQPLGQLHVISVRHKLSMDSLSHAARVEWMDTMIALQRVLRRAFEADSVTWLGRFAARTGGANSHVSWSMVPSYTGIPRFAGRQFPASESRVRTIGSTAVDSDMLGMIAKKMQEFL